MLENALERVLHWVEATVENKKRWPVPKEEEEEEQKQEKEGKQEEEEEGINSKRKKTCGKLFFGNEYFTDIDC